MNMNAKGKILCLVIIMQLFAFSVYAGEYNALRKFGRGFTNISLSIIEIPRQMTKVSREEGMAAGTFYGLLKGCAFFVGRAAVGTLEIITFPFPPYKPLIEPEFVLTDEDFSSPYDSTFIKEE